MPQFLCFIFSLLFSLYPDVCKNGMFPVGHPIIITEGCEQNLTADNQPYCGLLKVRVAPPRGLIHGLLPYHSADGKLCFPLCRTCCDLQAKTRCQHSEEERSFVGSFVSVELNKALSLGYKVTEVFEVWHYEETREYDKIDPDTGLFVR